MQKYVGKDYWLKSSCKFGKFYTFSFMYNINFCINIWKFLKNFSF